MSMLETPEDIRREGLNALEERHAWVDSLTLADVKAELKALRKSKARTTRRRTRQ